MECEQVNDGEPITIFELITAAAFLKFSKTKSDFLILETGLGGRLDATNVIQNPLVSVITPIGIDHQQFLGNSVKEIALEKAGIIKDKCKTVLSYQDKNIIPIFQDIINSRNNISKIWNKDYFVIDKGYSKPIATLVITLVGGMALLSSLLGGYLGNHLYKKNPRYCLLYTSPSPRD